MKSFKQFIKETHSSKIKSHKTVEQIAKKHRLSVSFIQKQLDMGEPIEHEHTKDHTLAMDIALQHLNEIPDYYTRLKKMESSAKKEHKKFKDVTEGNLRRWFRGSKSKNKEPGWVDVVDGDACAREEGETATPKCVSSEKRASMSKEERLAAQAAKRREDPNQPQKSDASRPTMVKTDRKTRTEEMNLQEVKDKPGKGSGEKDACYKKVKSRYKVWPSAYASGALVKCRKVGADSWGTKSESTDSLGGDWHTPIRERADRYCPKCEKLERRTECKYGTKYWDMFSLPAEIISSKKDYNITMPYPANESATIEDIDENYLRIQTRGTTYSILLNWRGKYITSQMFFPQFTRPTKKQVTDEVRKVYPNAIVLSFNPSTKDPTKPLLFTGEPNGTKNY